MKTIRWSRHCAVTAALVLATGCALAPSELPEARYLVAVKGVRVPVRSWLPWIARFADHLWVDVKGDDGWVRLEWNGHMSDIRVAGLSPEEARADVRWERQVRVVAWHCGEPARRIAAAAVALAPKFPYRGGYQAWPGPNSNTFVAWLARETPGLTVELPTTAAGKDYATWVRTGVTTTRTGLELETMIVGVKVGIREGVELNFAGLTAGVGIWPPSIKLPFLPAFPFGFWRRGSAD